MVARSGKILLHSRWLQVGLLIGLWWVCARLAHALALPVPGGILAMGLLLALLLTGGLRKAWVRRGTSGLLDHMILFFVPAVMALLNHRDLLGMTGVKILAVIVASTLVVMVGTASVVELTMSWRQRHVG